MYMLRIIRVVPVVMEVAEKSASFQKEADLELRKDATWKESLNLGLWLCAVWVGTFSSKETLLSVSLHCQY